MKFSKINKKFIIFSILIAFGILFISSAFAATNLEVNYPNLNINGVYTPKTTETSVPALVKYIFYLSLIIGVIIVTLVLIYNGFIFITSTGSPEKMKDAKEGITAALFGLLILVSSVVVLKLVNPQLAIMKIQKQEPKQGVALSLTNGSETEKEYIGVSISNLEERFPKLKSGNNYHLSQIQVLNPSEIKVILYSDANYKGTSQEFIDNSTHDISGNWKSLKIKPVGPGIYLYGDSQEYYFMSSNPSFLDFNNKAKFIKIKNSSTTDFAAILHEKTDYLGQCKIFFTGRSINGINYGNLNPNTTTSISGADEYGEVDEPSSAHAFQISNKYKGEVKLCNKIDYKGDCKSYADPIWKAKDLSSDLKEKTYSLDVDGNFVVILYEKNPVNGSGTGDCEVFLPYTKIPDLSKEPIGQCHPGYGFFFWSYKPCPTAIAIYPVKY